SAERIAMQVGLALIQALPQIIAQSIKPLENIDGIKILHVEGLNGAGHATNSDASGGGLAEHAVAAALRYRGQAPLIDALMKELGLQGGDLSGMTPAALADGTAPKPKT